MASSWPPLVFRLRSSCILRSLRIHDLGKSGVGSRLVDLRSLFIHHCLGLDHLDLDRGLFLLDDDSHRELGDHLLGLIYWHVDLSSHSVRSNTYIKIF